VLKNLSIRSSSTGPNFTILHQETLDIGLLFDIKKWNYHTLCPK